MTWPGWLLELKVNLEGESLNLTRPTVLKIKKEERKKPVYGYVHRCIRASDVSYMWTQAGNG